MICYAKREITTTIEVMKYLQRSNLSVLGLGIIFLAGCGGGQSAVPTNTGQSQTTTVGGGTVTYFGQPKPLITASSGNITVSALAGATFTAVKVNPAPIYNNTFFAYARTVGGVSAVYELPYVGGAEQLLTHSVEGTAGPAVSKTGYIFYNQLIGIYPYLMRADGSNNRQLSISGPAYFLNPSVSPNSAYTAFDGGGEELWYAPLAGGAAKLIQTNDNGYGTSFEPNNSTVAYVTNYEASNDIYTTSINGGSTTNVTPYSLNTTGNWSQPNCSVDGLSIAATYTPTSSSKSQVIVFQTNTSAYITITPSTYSDSCPSFSPDGTEIAFYRSSTGGAVPGIYVSDYSGENQRLVFEDPAASEPITQLCWSPFPAGQTLLGVGSNLDDENVTGFLLSQNGQVFGGICGFATTTAADATVSSPSGTSGQPLVFTLGGDNITMIEYTNSIFDLYGETLVALSGTTKSALVTVDVYTGGIDTVATAASVVRQTATRVPGGNLTYTAKFKAIYDSKGSNLAPAGATQVVVNPATGKLISFQ